MNYIITAAGKGSRFLKEGIKPPKPLIKVLGTELIIWSLNSFTFNKNDNLYIVSLKDHNVKKNIHSKLKKIFPFINIYWLELNSLKNGQLLTALEVVNFYNIKGAIVIHNCDTSYKANTNLFEEIIEKKSFGAIPYFHAEGDNWSFIEIKNKIVSKVREKEMISNNCSVGTYLFCDAKKFKNLANQYIKNKNSNFDEFYIAPFYDFAINKGMLVEPIFCDFVKVYGTCSELLKTFNISFYDLLSENDFNGHQRKTLVIDIDQTLCVKPQDLSYSECVPINEVCEKLRAEDLKGSYIILYTSRNMRSLGGNLGLINKHTAKILNNWLEINNIPYDEIYFGKPWGKGDLIYVDDKMISIDEFKNI